jgi:hypothetical protein
MGKNVSNGKSVLSMFASDPFLRFSQHMNYAKHCSGNCNWFLSWINMCWSNCIRSSLIYSHLYLGLLSDPSCNEFFLAGCDMCPTHLFLIYIVMVRSTTHEMFCYVFFSSWTYYFRPCLFHRSWFDDDDDNNNKGFGGLVVSMLASGTQVRGFKPGQSRRIFQAKKSSACLPSEGK